MNTPKYSCELCDWPLAPPDAETEAEYARDYPTAVDLPKASVCGMCKEYLQGGPASRALVAFVRESNMIEGIHRDPTPLEVVSHWYFMRQPQVTVPLLEWFVGQVQNGARLRRREGSNVYVGNHVPPPGGPGIERALLTLLAADMTPEERHWRYETLHPFTDGNGRSGRAMWLHQRGGPETLQRGFLHQWYYESLSQLRPLGAYEQRGSTV